MSSREARWLAAGVVLYFAMRFWCLGGQIASGMYDEGVYLATMKLLASQSGTLYRDILCVHPPGVFWTGAWLWSITHGSVFAIRAAYVIFCGLAVAPVYALARRVFGAEVAVATVFLMAVTPGLSGWLGHCVYLEQPLNVFLYTALWLVVAYPRSIVHIALAGAVVAAGYLVKEIALPAIAAIALGLLLVDGPRVMRRSADGGDDPGADAHITPWLALLIGAGLVLLPLLAGLCRIPNYFFDTVTADTLRPYAPSTLPHELLQGFYQLPLQLTFGACGVVLMAARPRNRGECLLGVYAVAMTVVMVIAPKSFYWRFLTPVVPVLSMAALAYWRAVWPWASVGTRRTLMLAGAVICATVHLASLAIYYHGSAQPPAQHIAAVNLLRHEPGPVFTLDPAWAIASDSALPRWPYAADTFMPRRIGLASVGEYEATLRQCPTAVVDQTTHELLPPAIDATIRRDYESVFRYRAPRQHDYVEVFLRRDMWRRWRGEAGTIPAEVK